MNMPATWNMGPNGFAPVQYGSDAHLSVVFHNKEVLNPRKSQEMGRPFYEGVDFVRIQQPGERDYTDRPVEEVPETKMRFAAQWQAYLQNQTQVPEGTPVSILFPRNPETAANLQTVRIHTVEQLASLSMEGIQRVGLGAQDWVNKAKKYLEDAAKGSSHHKFDAEIKKRDEVIEDLSGKLDLALSQINVLQEQQRMMASSVAGYAAIPPQTASASGLQPPMVFANPVSADTAQPKRRGRPPAIPA